MIIDFHAHVTPAEFARLVDDRVGLRMPEQGFWRESERLEAMDRGKVDRQVLSCSTGQEFYAVPRHAIQFARAINNGVAAICRQHPDRFVGLCSVPLDQPDQAIPELERAVQELGLRGISVPSNVNGRTLDDTGFQAVFAKINDMKLPVFVHAVEREDFPEAWRLYRLDHYIGWPVDSAVSVCKLICSGALDRHRNLTLVVSHLGGPIHTLMARIDRSNRDGNAQRRPAEYLKSFYYDTAGPSHAGAVLGAVKTVGAGRIVFGTDLPWGQEGDYLERALASVEEAGLPPEQRELIYSGNARRILGL